MIYLSFVVMFGYLEASHDRATAQTIDCADFARDSKVSGHWCPFLNKTVLHIYTCLFKKVGSEN